MQVCSNFNETFRSDCEIHQMRCFCEQEIPNRRCEDPEKYKHVHIEYYGNKGSHLLVHNYTVRVHCSDLTAG